jgi:NADP-dependent 3-hydroxy acid dehydrogenase YdfG
MYAFCAVLVVIAAVFLMGDADIPLLFLRLPKQNSFHKSVVWITGASSGLGAQMAKDFSRHGAQVILSARRVEQLEIVKKEILAEEIDAPEPYLLPLDVTDLDAQSVAVENVLATFGHLDIMVLNAGQSQRLLAADMPFKKFQELMHLNFGSVVHLAQLVLPSMKNRKQGHVRVTLGCSV